MYGKNSTVEMDSECLQAWWLQTGRGLWQMRDLTFHLKACKKSHWQQISIRLPVVWYATHVPDWETNGKHWTN